VTGIIEEHNLLSGYRLVVVEYLVVGLALGLLGAWYASVGRAVDAITWLGITANCLVIKLLADAQLRSGRPDLGVLALRHRAVRDAVLPEHPHLWRRTILLILVASVPFAIVLAVFVESLRNALRGVARA
jgi:hypothetical protein